MSRRQSIQGDEEFMELESKLPHTDKVCTKRKNSKKQNISRPLKMCYISIGFLFTASFAFILNYFIVEATMTDFESETIYYCWKCLNNCTTINNVCAGRPGESGVDIGKGLNCGLLVTSILSLLTSLYVAIDILGNPRRRSKVIYIMLCCMTITYFLLASKFVISSSMYLARDLNIVGHHGKKNQHPLCQISGFAGQLFGLAAISWNFMISGTMLYIFIYPFKFRIIQNDRKAVRRHVLMCATYVLVTSLVTTLAAFLTENIEYTSDGTCWMKNGWFMTFYGPLFLYYIFSVTTLIVTTVRTPPDSDAGAPSKYPEKYAIYTMAFVLSWSYGLAFRIDDTITSNPNIYLTYCASLFLGLQGWFDFVVYVFL